jgi:hypothetical protein
MVFRRTNTFNRTNYHCKSRDACICIIGNSSLYEIIIVTMHYALDHFQLRGLKLFQDLFMENPWHCCCKAYIDRPASVFRFWAFFSNVFRWFYNVVLICCLSRFSVDFRSIIQFRVTALSEHIFAISILSLFSLINIQLSEPYESSSCGFVLNQVMHYLIIVVLSSSFM